MAKRVRIYGPGIDDGGTTIKVGDEVTGATVAAFLEAGVHSLTDTKGNETFWMGGPGCPFLFVLETYNAQASRIY
jgi:hypothetical protein